MGLHGLSSLGGAALLLMVLADAFSMCQGSVRRLQRTTYAASTQQPFAQPNYTLYHAKDAVLGAVAATVARSPDTMSYDIKSAQSGDYAVRLPIVSAAPGGRGSAAAAGAPPRTRVLISFGQHAREHITVELGLRFLEVLAAPGALSKYTGDADTAARMAQLLTMYEFRIAPIENPNGRGSVEAGNLCERKNGRGVDPNRNWDIDFGKKERDYDPREEYPGASPFSEPEVQVVLAVAKQFQPHVWVNVHSGMEAFFTPYDHIPKEPSGQQEQVRAPLHGWPHFV